MDANKHEYDFVISGFDLSPKVSDVFTKKLAKGKILPKSNGLVAIDVILEGGEYRELDPAIYAYAKKRLEKDDHGRYKFPYGTIDSQGDVFAEGCFDHSSDAMNYTIFGGGRNAGKTKRIQDLMDAIEKLRWKK